jgi:uncharacterized protein (DUF1330 family)
MRTKTAQANKHAVDLGATEACLACELTCRRLIDYADIDPRDSIFHSPEPNMAAYVVVEIDIHDAATYERYKALVPPTIAAHGGRYLARGGAVDTLEGDWKPRRVVLLEFPSAEHARGWWSAPEAAHIKALRQQSARTRMIVVSGL